jgi:hypothetical protein
VDEEQIDFLVDECCRLSVMGALQRASIYAAGVSEKERVPFQKYLYKWLKRRRRTYSNKVSGLQHRRRIASLADALSTNFSHLLRGGRFRIGPAQKALNLFLKYLWCLGLIHEPPHCPFDSRIIKRCKSDQCWTKFDTMDDYLHLVNTARVMATPLSLARWELATWKRPNPKVSR